MKKILITGFLGMIFIAMFLYLKPYTKTELKHSFEQKIERESGDLLALYGEKPEHLQFKELIAGKIQVSYEALYEVEGKYSKNVESFLVEKYGMGKLKWVCCGYENTNGQKGSITVESEDGNDFDLLIGMHTPNAFDMVEGVSIPISEREKLTHTVSVQLLRHKNF